VLQLQVTVLVVLVVLVLQTGAAHNAQLGAQPMPYS
jgi:hypothetical protein